MSGTKPATTFAVHFKSTQPHVSGIIKGVQKGKSHNVINVGNNDIYFFINKKAIAKKKVVWHAMITENGSNCSFA